MKVLLTGATGFLGSEIARELVRQGHTVRVLHRKTSKLDGLAGLPIEKVIGDVMDPASLDAALDGMEALIHTAGHTGARRRDKKGVYEVNVEGVRNVMTAAARHPHLRVVHTSSVAAVGKSKDQRLLDESAVWDSAGTAYHYVISKRRGEEVALEFAKNGLNVIVLNPGMILGPGDVYITSTRFVLEYIKGRNRIYLKGGLSFCDVREVAKAHVAALTKGRAGERYILAGQNVTLREAQDTMYKITGLHRPIRMPYALAYLGALFSEGLSLVTKHGLEEFNRPVIRYAKTFSAYDCSKAARELDYVIRPFDESVRDTVRDFVSRGLADVPAVVANAGAAA